MSATAADAAYTLLENLKPFLSQNQKNKTPYEPLNGYYYISWSTAKDRGEELVGVMEKFISK